MKSIALMSLALYGSLFAMEADEARHLLSRTQFGVEISALQQLLPMEYDAAVQHLLDNRNTVPTTVLPDWLNGAGESNLRAQELSEDEIRDLMRERSEQNRELKTWWINEMLNTSSPLTEKMTLFWHNHFVSSSTKVKVPQLMYNQNALFRREALGSFKTMLYAVIRDPAMLIYLDNTTNQKDDPNENLARELLELFALGEGHYGEEDVKEAARALTGYKVNRRTGAFLFNARQHDSGNKRFLDHNGTFDGEDIVDILLKNDQTARFVVTKLWKEFVNVEPLEEEVERLAAIFRKNDYMISPLMHAMLTSEAFKSSHHQLIKAPAELIVGTVRMLNIDVNKPQLLMRLSAQLGQDLFDPPNVKGWPGHTAWIDTASLLNRYTIMTYVTRNMTFATVVPGEDDLRKLQFWLVGDELTGELPTGSYSAAYNVILRDPAFQLK